MDPVQGEHVNIIDPIQGVYSLSSLVSRPMAVLSWLSIVLLVLAVGRIAGGGVGHWTRGGLGQGRHGAGHRDRGRGRGGQAGLVKECWVGSLAPPD